MRNKQIRDKITDLNVELHKEFYYNNTDIGGYDEYVSTMLMFLNSLDGITVKRFSDLEEINTYLTNINDIEAFKDFYDEKGGKFYGSFMVDTYESGLYFIGNDGLSKFVDVIITTSDDDVIIKFNKFIMKKLFDKEYE